jgi:hypothetical protein
MPDMDGSMGRGIPGVGAYIGGYGEIITGIRTYMIGVFGGNGGMDGGMSGGKSSNTIHDGDDANREETPK